MQGLPPQLLKSQAKAEAFGDKKISAFAEKSRSVDGSDKDGVETSEKGEFSSLFANLKGKSEGKSEEKSSEIKSENSEILKNLLGQKVKNENGEVVSIDPKMAAALQAALAKSENAESKTVSKDGKSEALVQGKVEQKITKTSSNLDQLLNSIKGTQDSEESTELDSQSIKGMNPKKGEKSIKGELKTESPLDFLMKGTKTKGVSSANGEAAIQTSTEGESENVHGSVKNMSGEDFLKNKMSAEKKTVGNLTLLNGADLPKNSSQNVKAYGQGLTLLSDPLIKNTKDLASKDIKGKSAHNAIDELHSPDTKAGAELSAIKQEVIPGIQANQKESHGQQAETQTQANQKVLDLGKINTANTTEIIKRISDYVQQNQVANKSSLDLTVKHDSLGEFKIQVSKQPTQSMNQGLNLIDMQITTSSKEGHDFFVKNEVSLMKNLNQAGVNLSDLRIVTTMSESTSLGQSDSKQSSSQNQSADGSSRQAMSFESNNFTGDESGKERRKELWDEYQQRFGA